MTGRARIFLRAGLFWAGLQGLLGLAFLVTFLGWPFPVLLAVSAAMALLVSLRAMELPKTSAIGAIAALAGALFLIVMFALTFADELTRDHTPSGFDRTRHPD